MGSGTKKLISGFCSPDQSSANTLAWRRVRLHAFEMPGQQCLHSAVIIVARFDDWHRSQDYLAFGSSRRRGKTLTPAIRPRRIAASGSAALYLFLIKGGCDGSLSIHLLSSSRASRRRRLADAQVNRATISGMVTDPQGAPIPGVTITHHGRKRPFSNGSHRWVRAVHGRTCRLARTRRSSKSRD